MAHVQSSKHRESQGRLRGSVSWSQELISGDGMVMYMFYITVHINGICSALLCNLCVVVRVNHCNYTQIMIVQYINFFPEHISCVTYSYVDSKLHS